MRRTAALAALLLLSLGVAAAATAPKPPAPVFVLAGGGWGHGVGMSQWGAYGQAKAGRDYREILSTYYRGTAMGAAPDTLLKRVRVLVADGVANVSVANVAAVFDGGREAIPDRRRDDHRRLRPGAPGGQGRQAGGARRPRDDPRREGRVPVLRGQGVPRRPAGGGGRRTRPARQRRRAGGVPPRRRPGRDAEGLAARGARGAGGRGADVRGRQHRPRTPVRPLLGLAQPGLLRRRLGGARHRPGPYARPAGRSSRTTARPRRRSTSRRAAAGRSARSTRSASISPTSSRSTIRGTPRRRTTRGRRGS